MYSSIYRRGDILYAASDKDKIGASKICHIDIAQYDIKVAADLDQNICSVLRHVIVF